MPVEIAGYTIENKLGVGSLATVYLATQDATGHQVALKIHRPELSLDPKFQALFQAYHPEFVDLRHANYMEVYDFGVSNGHCYIAMAYFPEGPVAQQVLSQKQAKEHVLALTQQTANVLGFLHDAGYVHGRIKPTNLFFNAQGQIVLSEVEVAREIIDHKLSYLAKDLIAQARYVSPERILGRRADNRSDFYCFGLAVYELLTGRLPYDSDDSEVQRKLHIEGDIPTLPSQYATLQPVLNQLLAKNPQSRIGTTKQFSNVVRESGLQASKPAALPEQRPEERIVPPKSSGLPIGAIVLVAMIAVGAVFVVMQSEEDVPEETTDNDNNYDFGGKFELEDDAPKVDQAQLNTLLSRADKQFAAGHLIDPPGNNAYESYQSVLELAQNDEAEQGLARIASHYYQAALEAKEVGNLDASLSFIDQGRSRFPLDTGLLYLNESVKDELDKTHQVAVLVKKQKGEVKALVVLAKQQIAQRALTEPSGSNAFETFQMLAKLEPDQKWVERGSRQIVDKLIALATTSLQQQAFQDGIDFVQRGMNILPQDAALARLNQQLLDGQQQKLAETQHKEALVELKKQAKIRKVKIDRLVRRSEIQFNASKLTSPVGDNALETFQAIQALDQNHPIARSGLNRIADRYLVLAKKRKMDHAIELVNKGLEILPLHAELNAYRLELMDKQDKQQATQKVHDEKALLVQNLIEQADRQFALKRLTSPKGDNVFETFQQIQSISPRHPAAKKGFNRIANQYLLLAKKKVSQRSLKTSLAMVRKGLTIVPTHKGLLSFKQSIEAKIKASKTTTTTTRRRVAKSSGPNAADVLFKKINKQFQRNRVLRPKGNNALETYDLLVKFAPQDSRLEEANEKIMDYYVYQAKKALSKKTLKQAHSLIQDALNFNAKDNEALILRDSIVAAIEAKQQAAIDAAVVKVVPKVEAPKVTEAPKVVEPPIVEQPKPEEKKRVRTFGTF